MIKICDTIMGGGKTSAAIAYINDHPEKKFLYLTPFLEEAHRIYEACPKANFVEPSCKIARNNFKKINHIKELIKDGKNISSTHALSKSFTKDIANDLRDNHYVVIIDEAIEVLEQCDQTLCKDDEDLLIEADVIRKDSCGNYILGDTEYNGSFSWLVDDIRSERLVRINSGSESKSGMTYNLVYPKWVLESAEEVIILTYMCKDSMMESMLKMFGLEYQYIGIKPRQDGRYEFTEDTEYVPSYVGALPDLLHIFENKKLNAIGGESEKSRNLSKGWYQNHSDGVDLLRRNTANFFLYYMDSSPDKRLCGVYDGENANMKTWSKLRGKGYWNSNLSYNCRATNKYRHADALAYLVNLYPNTGLYNWFYAQGYPIDQDQYALSIMVQWIWRSAIRDGNEVTIYVPSTRMRSLLYGWIDRVSRGEHA